MANLSRTGSSKGGRDTAQPQTPMSPETTPKPIEIAKKVGGLANLRSRVTSSQLTAKGPEEASTSASSTTSASKVDDLTSSLNQSSISNDSTNTAATMAHVQPPVPAQATPNVIPPPAPTGEVSFATEDLIKLDTKSINASKVNLNSGNMTVIKGRGVGIAQKEPDWTPDQIRAINRATSTILGNGDIIDSRTSRPDPDQLYIAMDNDSSPVVQPRAALGVIPNDEYIVCVGVGRYDTTGQKPRMYHDVVMREVNDQWMSSQWRSAGIIIQGMTRDQLDSNSGSQKRRMGYDFARIGLPKYNFGPLFNTLSRKYPGCLDKFKQSKGYYWINASWGVGKTKGLFCFPEEDGSMSSEHELSSVLRRLNARSSMSDCIVAFALAQQTNEVNGENVGANTGFEISVKLHTCQHFADVAIYGPPLTTSTGMLMSSEYISKAKPLPRPQIHTSSTMGAKGPTPYQAMVGISGSSTVTSENPSAYLGGGK